MLRAHGIGNWGTVQRARFVLLCSGIRGSRTEGEGKAAQPVLGGP